MLSRKRPRVSSATGTWKPRKKSRVAARNAGGLSSGLRTGGWRGVPGRRGELKYVDVLSAADITTTGVLVLLNGLAPGTGASQRIGKKCHFRSLLLRYNLGANAAGATAFQGFVRVMIFLDTQTNATAPTVAQLLETVTASSPMNMDNRDRFKVLYDQGVPISQAPTSSSDCRFMKIYKKLNVTTIFNNGTAGTVADITSGSIYLLSICEQAGAGAAPTTTPRYDFISRLRYDDA